jgi:hypothetical protein
MPLPDVPPRVALRNRKSPSVHSLCARKEDEEKGDVQRVHVLIVDIMAEAGAEDGGGHEVSLRHAQATQVSRLAKGLQLAEGYVHCTS